MTDMLSARVKLLEAKIQEQNQLIASLQGISVVSLLFGGYMHDLNNRLSHLSTLLAYHFEICSGEGTGQNPRDEHLRREIRGVMEEIEDMNNNMRNVAIGREAADNTSIEECIQAATMLVRQHLGRLGATLKLELTAASENIRVPKQQFTNVLLVMMMNALDAFREIDKKERVIVIRTTQDHDSMYITIEDNGCGMAKDVIAKIWEPGFTTKRGGSGLGMAWARMFVVQVLGGKIEVESELGKFTRVRIVLPAMGERGT